MQRWWLCSCRTIVLVPVSSFPVLRLILLRSHSGVSREIHSKNAPPSPPPSHTSFPHIPCNMRWGGCRECKCWRDAAWKTFIGCCFIHYKMVLSLRSQKNWGRLGGKEGSGKVPRISSIRSTFRGDFAYVVFIFQFYCVVYDICTRGRPSTPLSLPQLPFLIHSAFFCKSR